MVHRIQTAQARKRFASLVDRSARGERIKLTRYNQTQAVLIPKHDLERLERCEKEREREDAARAAKPAPAHRRARKP